MRIFKKFVETFNSGSFVESCNVSEELIRNIIPEAKVFVINEDLVPEKLLDDPMLINPDDAFAIPFKTCWFEFMGATDAYTGLSNKNLFTSLGENSLPPHNASFIGWLCHEREPGDLFVAILVDVVFEDKRFPSNTVVLPVSSTNEKIRGKLLQDVGIMINALNGDDTRIGYETNHEKLKIKNNDGTKIFHKVKKIVHVWPKKKSKSKTIDPVNIIWTHRWWSRGHWRDLQGRVGKDRAGDYCIVGKTWVIESVKGDPEMPIINKVRVVHNQPHELPRD
jgi:hypothetical protein